MAGGCRVQAKAIAASASQRTVALHGKQEYWWRFGLGAGAARPIFAVIGDQHLEMLNTRYLRLLQAAADGRLRLAGCTVAVRLCLKPSAGRFFPAPITRSVYGRIDLTVCAITTKR